MGCGMNELQISLIASKATRKIWQNFSSQQKKESVAWVLDVLFPFTLMKH